MRMTSSTNRSGWAPEGACPPTERAGGQEMGEPIQRSTPQRACVIWLPGRIRSAYRVCKERMPADRKFLESGCVFEEL